ncbi:unnamed protein product [Polarella glacialis]|uniref:Rab-GAP TBC domain-containing protein n=1 Tax=Polarella glacialis TaxID=89957 RepID=A0A813LFV1_POLGL|nr:unnamed protein product [Polarella glacialis]
MSEIGAVMLHVMMQGAEHAEADAFWCFNALMAEVKIRFLLDPGRRTADLQALLGTKCPSLLSKYDPELAKHFEECDLEPGVVALRWYMLLLAGAAAVPDVLQLFKTQLVNNRLVLRSGLVIRWWDAFFADARRFELCDYACVALVMEHREELLRTRNVVTLAEILQFVPLEKGNFEPMVRKAWAICALQWRVQSPPYPPLSTAVAVQEMAGAFFTGLFKNF